jgi:uncharacterized protein
MFPRALLPPVNPPLSRQNDPMADVRVTVRVKPGASRTRVGGVYGEGELIVAVNAPPVDGAANEALTIAVAKALGIRPRHVTLVSGHTARSKVLSISVADADVARLESLLKDLLSLS